MKLLRDVFLASFAGTWKNLFLTDFLFKILAFALLTPLFSILFRLLIAVSGRPILADQDIALFFLGPVGWVCLILIGALWLGIVALELGALLVIVSGHPAHRIRPVGALRFASANAWRIVQVSGRMIGWVLLISAPFLVTLVAVYFLLLSEHDINFYLKERPPVFLGAAGAGVFIVLALSAVLLRVFAGWFHALPMVLFENISPASALAESRKRATGQRSLIVVSILIWLVATSLLSALITGSVVGLGRLVVPGVAPSLPMLIVAVGGFLLLWSIANLGVNLLGTTTFAAMMFGLYRICGSYQEIDPSRLAVAGMDAGNIWFRVTRRRIAIGLVVGLIAAVAIGVRVVRSVNVVDHVEIMAHRGASAAAPENTLAAVRQAIADGADWVEIDVQETADGEVVVFHDSDFMKLAGNPLKLWEASLDDLKTIDIGGRFGPEFSRERVPTLAEVLAECKGKIGVNIELKYYGHDQDLENRVARIVEAEGVEDDIVLMSLKLDAVAKMKSLRPNWKVGLLMSVVAGNINSIEADFLAVNADFTDRSLVRSAHGNGKQILVWTVNDPITMSNMIGRGVDGLITDEPAVAQLVLQQRAQWSVTERLLVELAGVFGVQGEVVDQ